jgi:predicted transcriptional regulator
MKYISYQHNPRVSKILHIITESPGLTFTQIMSHSGLTNGVLSHYLNNMEKRSMIRSNKGKKMTWYFLPDHPPEEDWIVINLRKETSRNILSFLLTKKQATFAEIVDAVSRSPPVISIVLSKLEEHGIIRSTSGYLKKYSVANPDIIIRLNERINPTTFDRMMDRFSDTFSYL